MPLPLSDRLRPVLQHAVNHYRTELLAIRASVESTLVGLGQPSDQISVILAPLRAELEVAEETCTRIGVPYPSGALLLAAPSKDDFVEPMRSWHWSLAASALFIWREQLSDWRRSLRVAPLAPVEAIALLEGEISVIDHAGLSGWAAQATTEYFPTMRKRQRAQRIAQGWLVVPDWLLRLEDAGVPRTWAFCDTSFFLESRATFEQVRWNEVWDVPNIVLVVPQAMLRELDQFKGDSRRPRQQERSRRVLQIMEVIADSVGPGLPATVRAGVELLLSDAEPQTFPQGLDKELADDRLIAAAVEFQSYGEQVRVAVASEDIGPRQKARRFGLERLILPAPERRRDAAS